MDIFQTKKIAHGSMHEIMASPFKRVSDQNPSYFQFVKGICAYRCKGLSASILMSEIFVISE